LIRVLAVTPLCGSAQARCQVLSNENWQCKSWLAPPGKLPIRVSGAASHDNSYLEQETLDQ
jgi:hypothetical protein